MKEYDHACHPNLHCMVAISLFLADIGQLDVPLLLFFVLLVVYDLGFLIINC
ncbi:hypothetical protein FWI56_05515 [Francisella tularensis subsp. holarctica]|nr:hypothetical protein [Francisella tularensis subsp. holarctica]